MQFYNATKPLFADTSISGIRLDVMNCGHDKILHQTILCQIALTRKSRSSAGRQYKMGGTQNTA